MRIISYFFAAVAGLCLISGVTILSGGKNG